MCAGRWFSIGPEQLGPDQWQDHHPNGRTLCGRQKVVPGQMPPIQYSQTKIMGWFSGAYMTVENSPDQKEKRKTSAAHRNAKSFCRVDPLEQARRDRFNRAQQKRYESWLN
jgi:hypothetical protein